VRTRGSATAKFSRSNPPSRSPSEQPHGRCVSPSRLPASTTRASPALTRATPSTALTTRARTVAPGGFRNGPRPTWSLALAPDAASMHRLAVDRERAMFQVA
jgi:hypothetical protein